ncbi:hypothetical protein [Neobacillus sp. D3-1R]|uniref:hypothetical protein n=1 Tax=Neobacillus sp. D3-1R TaxID=3445778 RepID=UPI003F9ED270
MFDPTAFENMKVVIEGHLYDRDLDGDIKIVDRSDLVDLAKLSRKYSIKFCLNDSHQDVFAIFTLSSEIENLVAELLPMNNVVNKQGIFVLLEFQLSHQNEKDLFKKIQNEFRKIWGETRSIQQLALLDPLSESSLIQNRIIIDFKRLIIEDQMDDLIEMVTPMIETLSMLETIR